MEQEQPESEPEPDKRDCNEGITHIKSDGSYVLLPLGIRCPIQIADEFNRFLLVYNRCFLLPVGVVLWIVFLFA
tara:strand:+ start:2616 stop:2837 length:222 start_codon:yes stop_codon:yes gene_type:complete